MINSKYETLNSKQIQNAETQNSKQMQDSEAQNLRQYDLEERTLRFAARVRDYVKRLPGNTAHFEIGKQLFRSAGSVGANYIEANESWVIVKSSG